MSTESNNEYREKIRGDDVHARRCLRGRIRDTWKMFEEAEPDISTERLMEMTAQHCKCDHATVADAIQ